jgi:hypothetical protein
MKLTIGSQVTRKDPEGREHSGIVVEIRKYGFVVETEGGDRLTFDVQPEPCFRCGRIADHRVARQTKKGLLCRWCRSELEVRCLLCGAPGEKWPRHTDTIVLREILCKGCGGNGEVERAHSAGREPLGVLSD